MLRHRTLVPVVSLWGLACLGLPALAQTPPSTPPVATTSGSSAEMTILNALMANPATAPYRIVTSMRNGRVVLSGRVGTKRIHDIAIQTAIASGYPIQDDLAIDTAEANRVAAMVAMNGSGAAGYGPGMAGGYNPQGIAPLGAGAVPFVYPPPLFGRIDNPFFGFEPPLVSYPPWYSGVAARASAYYQAGATNPAQGTANVPATVVSTPAIQGGASQPAPSNGAMPTAPSSGPTTIPLGPSPQDGAVEMTIDPRGVAVLRGVVSSLAVRIAVGQQIAQSPGVSEVINLLSVAQTVAVPVSSSPPPPPQPAGPGLRPPPMPTPAVERAPQGAALQVDGGDLPRRVVQAFTRRPSLSDHPITVTSHEGVVTLSGRVPTVYEAMLAFRAAQQTPGVREVDDRLEFVVPDGEHPNPLRQKGRPDDVEPYLAAQIRRQIGDLAHVDQVRLLGDTVELRGTLTREEDRPRLDAILRSMPVLRGFRVEPTFVPE